MAISTAKFFEQLSSVSLLSVAELTAMSDPLSAEQKQADAESVANQLVKSGKLTKFQAAMLCQGRGKGLVLGEYIVLDKIGAGGMGQVFKAQHRRMKRMAAVKVLAPHITKDPQAVRRFYQEVEMAAKLTHPNIVASYDAAEAHGMHYLVMEFVDGSDLSSFLSKNGPLPLRTAIDCIRQAAEGLAYAHAQNVVHRDIKPGNLLLDKSGAVKILDMGLARTIDALEQQDKNSKAELTQAGQVMGTVDYMAPEQARDARAADHRADIYSLGCTLYRLLTGYPPFPADTMVKKIMAHASQPAPPITKHCAAAPAKLEMLYQKMMQKDPNRRIGSAKEVAATLADILNSPEAEIASESVLSPSPVAGDRSSSVNLSESARSESIGSTIFGKGSSIAPSFRESSIGKSGKSTVGNSTSGKSTAAKSTGGDKRSGPPSFAINTAPPRATADTKSAERVAAAKPKAVFYGSIAAVAIVAVAIVGWWLTRESDVVDAPEEVARLPDSTASATAVASNTTIVFPWSTTATPSATSSATAATVVSGTSSAPPTPAPSSTAKNSPSNAIAADGSSKTSVFDPKPNVGSGADRPPPATPAGTAVAVGGPGPSPTTASFLTPGISTVAETATSSPEKKRLPLPSDPEVDQARKAIRDIFKAEIAAAKKPEEKVPLAKKIYDQALADGEPLGRYAMLVEAAALGADGGNAQQVELASRLVASLFEVNEFNWSADIWDAAQKRQPTPAIAKAIVPVLIKLVDDAVAEEAFDSAKRLMDLALAYGRRAQDPATTQNANDRNKRYIAERQLYDTLAKARATLEATPDDPDANLLLGKHLCFVQDEWETGLPLLAKGKDPVFKELAAQSIPAPTEIAEVLTLGDKWWAKSEKPTAIKRELQVGAVHWYKIVQSAVTGIDKAKVDKRIADSAAALVGIKPVRKAKEPAKEMIVPLAPGVDLALNYISRGEFVMGGPSGYESPPHSVRISNGFYFGRFEITQAQWTAVMGTAPWIPAGSYQEGPDYAAGGISQLEASGYCFRLSEIARQQKSIPADARFRLPTEAEWEYACRAGTTSRYSYGDDGNVLGDFAWYESNASKAGESFAHRVGKKKPNAWGLFDMHGNLWELCSDWAGNYPNQAVVDPTGPASGDRVILRGGCWSNNGGNLTCSYRDSGSSSSRVSSSIGFRIVCEISPPAATR